MSGVAPREPDPRLAEWVDGELSPRERERFTAELRVNPQLQRDLAAYEQTVAAVRAALRAPAAPVDLTARILAAATAAPSAPAAAPRRHWAWLGSLAGAAALLAFAVWLNDLAGARPQVERAAQAPVPMAQPPADKAGAGVAPGEGAPAGDDAGAAKSDAEWSAKLPADQVPPVPGTAADPSAGKPAGERAAAEAMKLGSGAPAPAVPSGGPGGTPEPGRVGSDDFFLGRSRTEAPAAAAPARGAVAPGLPQSSVEAIEQLAGAAAAAPPAGPATFGPGAGTAAPATPAGPPPAAGPAAPATGGGGGDPGRTRADGAGPGADGARFGAPAPGPGGDESLRRGARGAPSPKARAKAATLPSLVVTLPAATEAKREGLPAGIPGDAAPWLLQFDRFLADQVAALAAAPAAAEPAETPPLPLGPLQVLVVPPLAQPEVGDPAQPPRRERSFVVEGRRADLALLLQRIGARAAAAGWSVQNGEAPVPQLPASTVLTAPAAPTAGAGPAAKSAADAVPPAERQRLLLVLQQTPPR